MDESILWEAELSSGRIAIESPGEPASWRWLMDYCRREGGLQIKELRYAGKPVKADNAEAYFVFHDMMAFMKGEHSITRKGVGYVYTSDGRRKVRINWYIAGTDKLINTEVRYIEDYPIAQEMMIPKWLGSSGTSSL